MSLSSKTPISTERMQMTIDGIMDGSIRPVFCPLTDDDAGTELTTADYVQWWYEPVALRYGVMTHYFAQQWAIAVRSYARYEAQQAAKWKLAGYSVLDWDGVTANLEPRHYHKYKRGRKRKNCQRCGYIESALVHISAQAIVNWQHRNDISG